MKCPLQTIKTGHYTSSSPNPTHITIDFFTCDKECGWWDQATEQCSILSIKNTLKQIHEDLYAISVHKK